MIVKYTQKQGASYIDSNGFKFELIESLSDASGVTKRHYLTSWELLYLKPKDKGR